MKIEGSMLVDAGALLWLALSLNNERVGSNLLVDASLWISLGTLALSHCGSCYANW